MNIIRINPDGSFIDPPSVEATVAINVEDPFNEPRIHKNIPGGPAELENYRQEVVNGIHNHWIDPGTNKWTYTYNERFRDYEAIRCIIYGMGQRRR